MRTRAPWCLAATASLALIAGCPQFERDFVIAGDTEARNVGDSGQGAHVEIDNATGNEREVAVDASTLDASSEHDAAVEGAALDGSSDDAAHDSGGDGAPAVDACSPPVSISSDDLCSFGAAGSSTFNGPAQFCQEGSTAAIAYTPTLCLCEYTCACIEANWPHSCGSITSCSLDLQGGIVLTCN